MAYNSHIIHNQHGRFQAKAAKASQKGYFAIYYLSTSSNAVIACEMSILLNVWYQDPWIGLIWYSLVYVFRFWLAKFHTHQGFLNLGYQFMAFSPLLEFHSILKSYKNRILVMAARITSWCKGCKVQRNLPSPKKQGYHLVAVGVC